MAIMIEGSPNRPPSNDLVYITIDGFYFTLIMGELAPYMVHSKPLVVRTGMRLSPISTPVLF